MDVSLFLDIQAEFMTRIGGAVYAVLATVDRENHPRQRLMHPVWEGSTAWMITRPGSLKTRHLQRNPAASLAYLQPVERPVYINGIAEWVGGEEEMQRVWDLYQSIPPPFAFDPQPHYGSIHHPDFGLLRLTAQRIELANLNGEPLIWRQPMQSHAEPEAAGM
jgi:general stress protein 26